MKVGLVGWRGMVGSVLMQRMVEENDFAHFEPFYFSTSNAGGEAPAFGGKTAPALMDASDIKSLKQMDVIITCQGGDYTSAVFPKLKAEGWNGYWIDAGGKITRTTYSIWAGTSWMYMTKFEYTYDANNRIATETRSDWNLVTQWSYVAMYEFKYDGNGNNTEYYTYKWENSQWAKQTKELTTFDLNYTYADLILPSGYSVFFSPYTLATVSGGMNKPLQDIEYAWNTGTTNWDNKSKTIYYYSAGPGTGVVEQKADDASAITIYPNPVANAFNLSTTEANVQISIFDLSGSLLLSKQISGSDPVDVSFLSGGIYMAKIVTEKAK
jgi:hypothetical protein